MAAVSHQRPQRLDEILEGAQAAAGPGGHVFDEHKPPARFEHAQDFFQAVFRLGHRAQHQRADHRVYAGVPGGQAHAFGIALLDAELCGRQA
jgi:hypothetical protein